MHHSLITEIRTHYKHLALIILWVHAQNIWICFFLSLSELWNDEVSGRKKRRNALSPDKKRRRPSVVSDILPLLISLLLFEVILLSISMFTALTTTVRHKHCYWDNFLRVEFLLASCGTVLNPCSRPYIVYMLPDLDILEDWTAIRKVCKWAYHWSGPCLCPLVVLVCIYVCSHIWKIMYACTCVLSSRPWLRWVPTEGRLTPTALCFHSERTEAGRFSTAEEHTHKHTHTVIHHETHKDVEHMHNTCKHTVIMTHTVTLTSAGIATRTTGHFSDSSHNALHSSANSDTSR